MRCYARFVYIYLTSSLPFAHQVTGMSRLTDTMFIGFAVRPDWNHRDQLSPARINIETVFSRHLQQNPRYQYALQLLENIVREEFAFPHVYNFPSRLNQVTDNGGYFVNTVNRRVIVNPVQLASGIAALSPRDRYHIPLSHREIGDQLNVHRSRDIERTRANVEQRSSGK